MHFPSRREHQWRVISRNVHTLIQNSKTDQKLSNQCWKQCQNKSTSLPSFWGCLQLLSFESRGVEIKKKKKKCAQWARVREGRLRRVTSRSQRGGREGFDASCCCPLSMPRITGTSFFLVTLRPGRARKGKANSGERDRKIKRDPVKGRTLRQSEAKVSYLSVDKYRKWTSFDGVEL